MHPVATSRLAFSLAARTGESSFPERHAEPDDMAHLHDHEPSYEHHHPHHEPGFPKLGLLPPSLSSFWQESWLEQYHPPQHDAPARHRQHHTQNHHWVDEAACFSPTSPADVMRIPSPQANHAHHPVFSPSPLPPSAPTDEVTTPSEWDTILHAAHLDFRWLPAQQQAHAKGVKFEDDSDSATWSGNDSNSNNGNSCSEEVPTPPPQPAAPRRTSTAPPRRRLGSVPRVTKLSKVPAPGHGGGGGVYHTFRMSKRPPTTTRPAAVVDLIEATPFGPHPITNFGAAGAAGGDAGDPAKMLEKRLAHKLSEKGRRNRLTSAIREIQKLMPLDAVTAAAAEQGGTGAAEGKAGEVVYPHFSKVDVVEMAIGYIRRLQKENEEMARRAKGEEGPPDGGGSSGTEL
ncbi:hypothetical protein B0T18DRAFT_184644 [Schizothecium vesticola]|uniref:BHLH domain-containing protein n=1 Tax=Schizothecium vesticola TaxID=314040 RepID=A0AA40EQ41_9PEZI|nr:hypothetical protein B0T18DRAFT_184644 [Schizothecium vesticola]